MCNCQRFWLTRRKTYLTYITPFNVPLTSHLRLETLLPFVVQVKIAATLETHWRSFQTFYIYVHKQRLGNRVNIDEWNCKTKTLWLLTRRDKYCLYIQTNKKLSTSKRQTVRINICIIPKYTNSMCFWIIGDAVLNDLKLSIEPVILLLNSTCNLKLIVSTEFRQSKRICLDFSKAAR